MPCECLDALTRRGRPDFDLLIVQPGNDKVASKLDPCQSAVVAFKGVQALTSGYVPEHDLSISQRADDLVVLRPYGVDRAVMS